MVWFGVSHWTAVLSCCLMAVSFVLSFYLVPRDIQLLSHDNPRQIRARFYCCALVSVSMPFVLLYWAMSPASGSQSVDQLQRELVGNRRSAILTMLRRSRRSRTRLRVWDFSSGWGCALWASFQPWLGLSFWLPLCSWVRWPALV